MAADQATGQRHEPKGRTSACTALRRSPSWRTYARRSARFSPGTSHIPRRRWTGAGRWRTPTPAWPSETPAQQGLGSAVTLLAAAPAFLQPPHEPRSRLGASPPAPGGAPFVAQAPVLGGGAAGHAPVAGHRPQGADEQDHKARYPHQDDIDHDPRSATARRRPGIRAPPRRPGAGNALAGRPRAPHRQTAVTGAERRFDLLKLAPFVLRERHSALR